MADPSRSVTLAMPVGLPPQGAAPAAHFTALQSRMAANLSSSMARIWIADEPAYSGVFSMSKGFVRLIPGGSPGPDGVTRTTPMLTLKPWLWDYLALRRNAPGGALPRLIGYGNLDATAVTQALRAELASNPRYQSLAAAERTQAETDFAAGTIKLLANAGTLLGRGLADSAAPTPAQPGWRRLDLIFFDEQNAPLDPSVYFDLWRLIGGAWVVGHPLLAALARPVTPGIAPIEGGTRIRVEGSGFVAGTSLAIDGVAATDVVIAANGTTLWATVPAHAAGSTDVVVTVPGQTAVTHPDALAYTEDLATTARAATLSYAVRISELRDRAVALVAAGTMDDGLRSDLRYLASSAARDAGDQIFARSRNASASVSAPEVGAAWEDAQSELGELTDQLGRALL